MERDESRKFSVSQLRYPNDSREFEWTKAFVKRVTVLTKNECISDERSTEEEYRGGVQRRSTEEYRAVQRRNTEEEYRGGGSRGSTGAELKSGAYAIGSTGTADSTTGAEAKIWVNISCEVVPGSRWPGPRYCSASAALDSATDTAVVLRIVIISSALSLASERACAAAAFFTPAR
jgi:hypothetical protein